MSTSTSTTATNNNNLNATSNVPGMMYPTQRAMLAGTPRDSANASLKQSNVSQANANKLMAGGKKKRNLFRGGDNIIVPQYTMLYTPQGGVGTNPNNQIQANAQTSTQMSANSVYDNYATIRGGRKRKSVKGGNYNPNWYWGCMSGGKYKKSKKIKKSKKQKYTKKTIRYRK